MERQLALHSRRLWLSVPALVGGLAGLALPGATSTTAAGAALLAVGALALLAGHAWGLTVLVPSHVTMAGQVWPDVAFHASSTATRWVVLVTAVPALILAAHVVPRMARELFPSHPARAQALFSLAVGGALVAALIVPALLS